jgi:hypothetical protein
MSKFEMLMRLLTVVTPIGTIIAAVVFYRLNKAKKVVGIEIDEETKNKLANEAAQINQDREQKREEWWTEQFTKLRDELAAETSLSNKRWRRMHQLEDWAMSHVAWDRRAWFTLRETHPDFPAPPPIPEEIVYEREQGNGSG